MANYEKKYVVKMPEKMRNQAFAKEIMDCSSELKYPVYIEKNGRTARASSLIGVLSLGIMDEEEVTVSCFADNDNEAKNFFDKIGKILNCQL